MRENKVYDFVFDLMYSSIVRNINVTNVSQWDMIFVIKRIRYN